MGAAGRDPAALVEPASSPGDTAAAPREANGAGSPVGDAAALGGLAAARYQLRVGACPANTTLQSVRADGTPVCVPSGVTAHGESHGVPIIPDANHAVAHLTLHAPAAGFVVFSAAYQVDADNLDADGRAFDCRVASQLGVTAGVPSLGPGYSAQTFPASQPTHAAGGAMALFPGWALVRVPVLERGDVTVFLSGASDCAAAHWQNVAIAATWEPGDATVAFGVH